MTNAQKSRIAAIRTDLARTPWRIKVRKHPRTAKYGRGVLAITEIDTVSGERVTGLLGLDGNWTA